MGCGDSTFVAFGKNMASWKCGAYVVVGTIVIILIILLNFDYLPKRRLTEELELTTKSSYKEFTASTDRPSTKMSTTTTSNSAVTKVRSLKCHAEFIYLLRQRSKHFVF